MPIDMILAPAGTFEMGSLPDDPAAWADEWPRHEVTLTRPFWIGATPVTQGQWREVTGENPSLLSSGGDDCPVENVSWLEAVDFCNRLSKKEGLREAYRVSGTTVEPVPGADGYRLPTEAEWEYAARAGGRHALYAGAGELRDLAWYSDNSGGKTHPVGEKAPNAWGLYDMSGNVLEWCWDWYAGYAAGAVTDPQGPERSSYRVIRGGSWRSDARFVRAAYRCGFEPGLRYGRLGFRLARTVP